MTIQNQFNQLISIRVNSHPKPFEVLDDRIVKKRYTHTKFYESTKDNPDGVIEEYTEFYLNEDKIAEKVTKRMCEFAIFSDRAFVLPDGLDFGEPFEENLIYHDKIIDLAFRFGEEFQKENFGDGRNKLYQMKWKPINEIVKEIDYIVIHGAGYNSIARKADTASVLFEKEVYNITHADGFYSTGSKKYKTAMALVLDIGIHKFQFCIRDNGGD